MGISAYTGYPDGKPAKAGQSYPDFIACWTGMTTLLAALIDRERTGLGQAVDQGMYQIGAALVPEAILAIQAEGRDLGRLGARDLDCPVSGVFESVTHDRWVAVSMPDLACVPDLAAATAGDAVPFAPADSDSPAEVEAALRAWVHGLDGALAVERLQAAGVAAGEVMSVADLIADEHLLERGFYEDVDFGDGQPRPVIGRPYRFSDHVAGVGGRAPRFGEHNREVLAGIGVVAEDIEALYRDGVLAEKPSRPVGAIPVDAELLTGAAGNFAAVHRDYLDRLRTRGGRVTT